MKEAIKKLDLEIEKNKKKNYITAIGEFMIQQVTDHPEYAPNILAEGKTLAGAYSEMYKVASEKKDGNCYCMDHAEAYAIVLDYYGITKTEEEPSAEPSAVPQPIPQKPETKAVPEPQAGALNLSLADFLK